MIKYRLYVDEVGNSDLGSSENENHRFLSLTGIAIELDYVSIVVHPDLENLKKKYFGSHPDDPIILHRKELVGKKPPFTNLKDSDIESAFNDDFLALLDKWDFTILSVIIDKKGYRGQK